MKPVAVFRFSDTEGPGHFATFLDASRVPWKLVKLDEGEAVPPSSEGYAGLGWPGFATMGIFVATLVAGLVYVWKKGALDWSE